MDEEHTNSDSDDAIVDTLDSCDTSIYAQFLRFKRECRQSTRFQHAVFESQSMGQAKSEQWSDAQFSNYLKRQETSTQPKQDFGPKPSESLSYKPKQKSAAAELLERQQRRVHRKKMRDVWERRVLGYFIDYEVWKEKDVYRINEVKDDMMNVQRVGVLDAAKATYRDKRIVDEILDQENSWTENELFNNPIQTKFHPVIEEDYTESRNFEMVPDKMRNEAEQIKIRREKLFYLGESEEEKEARKVREELAASLGNHKDEQMSPGQSGHGQGHGTGKKKKKFGNRIYEFAKNVARERQNKIPTLREEIDLRKENVKKRYNVVNVKERFMECLRDQWFRAAREDSILEEKAVNEQIEREMSSIVNKDKQSELYIHESDNDQYAENDPNRIGGDRSSRHTWADSSATSSASSAACDETADAKYTHVLQAEIQMPTHHDHHSVDKSSQFQPSEKHQFVSLFFPDSVKDHHSSTNSQDSDSIRTSEANRILEDMENCNTIQLLCSSASNNSVLLHKKLACQYQELLSAPNRDSKSLNSISDLQQHYNLRNRLMKFIQNSTTSTSTLIRSKPPLLAHFPLRLILKWLKAFYQDSYIFGLSQQTEFELVKVSYFLFPEHYLVRKVFPFGKPPKDLKIKDPGRAGTVKDSQSQSFSTVKQTAIDIHETQDQFDKVCNGLFDLFSDLIQTLRAFLHADECVSDEGQKTARVTTPFGGIFEHAGGGYTIHHLLGFAPFLVYDVDVSKIEQRKQQHNNVSSFRVKLSESEFKIPQSKLLPLDCYADCLVETRFRNAARKKIWRTQLDDQINTAAKMTSTRRGYVDTPSSSDSDLEEEERQKKIIATIITAEKSVKKIQYSHSKSSDYESQVQNKDSKDKQKMLEQLRNQTKQVDSVQDNSVETSEDILRNRDENLTREMKAKISAIVKLSPRPQIDPKEGIQEIQCHTENQINSQINDDVDSTQGQSDESDELSTPYLNEGLVLQMKMAMLNYHDADRFLNFGLAQWNPASPYVMTMLQAVIKHWFQVKNIDIYENLLREMSEIDDVDPSLAIVDDETVRKIMDSKDRPTQATLDNNTNQDSETQTVKNRNLDTGKTETQPLIDDNIGQEKLNVQDKLLNEQQDKLQYDHDIVENAGNFDDIDQDDDDDSDEDEEKRAAKLKERKVLRASLRHDLRLRRRSSFSKDREIIIDNSEAEISNSNNKRATFAANRRSSIIDILNSNEWQDIPELVDQTPLSDRRIHTLRDKPTLTWLRFMCVRIQKEAKSMKARRLFDDIDNQEFVDEILWNIGIDESRTPTPASSEEEDSENSSDIAAEEEFLEQMGGLR